jgi:hypothetical protein
MGHLIRVFGQDWYRLAAPERAGRPLGDVLPDWVDPRPVCFTQPPPRNPPPPDFWIFRFKRGKMLEHWDKGLFFDRAAAGFITREEYERRHPGILARDAPEAGEPAAAPASAASAANTRSGARSIAAPRSSLGSAMASPGRRGIAAARRPRSRRAAANPTRDRPRFAANRPFWRKVINAIPTAAKSW